MRITENTAARLTLRDRTLWVSVICFGAGLFGAAFFMLHPGPLQQLIPSALFIAFGLAFLRATDVTFDKDRRVCVMRRLDVLKVTRRQFAFDDITDIDVEVSSGGEDSRSLTCRLALATKAGVVALTASYEPDFARYNRMRDQIVDFLFAAASRPVADDPVRRLAKAGRVIDAVRVLRQRDGLDLTTARERVEDMRNAPDHRRD